MVRAARVAILATSLAVGACAQAPIEALPDAARIRRDAAIDAMSFDAGPRPACPPAPPYGHEVGDVLGDFVVYDCDGNPVRLHTLCETDVVWIWELAEWCSPCRRFAAGPYDAIYQRYATAYGARFAGLAVITADEELNLPDPVICRELRDRYGIDAPLYFDPTGGFRDVVGGLSNDVHAIMTRGMRVAWTMQFGGDFVNRRLQETFDALDRGTEIPDADVALDAGPLEDAFVAPDTGPLEVLIDAGP
jgi:thiol-disulfide isomerase/thioredoxin